MVTVNQVKQQQEQDQKEETLETIRISWIRWSNVAHELKMESRSLEQTKAQLDRLLEEAKDEQERMRKLYDKLAN